jgi:hypothetical protein
VGVVQSLSVHLEDGFDNDEVIVWIDGAAAHHLLQVTSKLLLGYARIVECGVSGPTARIRIEVVSRGLQAETTVPAAGAVLASIRGDELELRHQGEAPGYL